MNKDENIWDETITPKRSFFDFRFRELWHYRNLVSLFVRRDFVSVYKQTILGPLWYFIQPLLTTIVFTVIFSRIAGLSTDGLPPILFYLAGITAWNFFSKCITGTSNTFANNAQLFGKVYFPRIAVPISSVISNFFTFLLQVLFLLIFIVIYYFKGVPVHFSSFMLLLPVVIIGLALTGMGLGLIISSLTTKYRDLQFLVVFGVQLFMYATPIIYPISTVSGKLKMVLLANPVSAYVETFRAAFLGHGTVTWVSLLYCGLFSLLIFFLGILIFNKVEKNFMDTV
jgi:lipopolysaccharide transport system permease protein